MLDNAVKELITFFSAPLHNSPPARLVRRVVNLNINCPLRSSGPVGGVQKQGCVYAAAAVSNGSQGCLLKIYLLPLADVWKQWGVL